VNILYLSAEVAPYAKVGGLGDVGGGLPRALRARGHDVHVFLPAYRQIDRARYGFEHLPEPHGLHNGAGEHWFGVSLSEHNDVPTYLIEHDALYDRALIYGYPDDPSRFIFLCQAALAFAQDRGYRPDIVHCHDWHTSYALAWLDTAGRASAFYRDSAGVLTVHNAAHQGRSSYATVRYGGLDTWLPPLEPHEPWGEVNWLARGVRHADAIAAVSPRFAHEISTPEGGWGLDGLFRARGERLMGILNGIDTQVWDPAHDPHLAATYTADALDARLTNKRALQQRLGLPVRDETPLVAFVGRLDAQKGVEFLTPALEALLDRQDMQFVLLGSGAQVYEQRLQDVGRYHPDKVALVLRFDADLAPLIYAGCDVFLMPSLFEPCGLGQLIAMRYGAVPLVRATGGLADTVSDSDPFAQQAGTGFVFDAADAGALGWRLDRALQTYRWDKGFWRQVQVNGMHQDFSWERSAAAYEALYARAREWHWR
jgi:starch synthase